MVTKNESIEQVKGAIDNVMHPAIDLSLTTLGIVKVVYFNWRILKDY